MALTPDDLAVATASEAGRADMSRRAFSDREYGEMLDTNLLKPSHQFRHSLMHPAACRAVRRSHVTETSIKC